MTVSSDQPPPTTEQPDGQQTVACGAASPPSAHRLLLFLACLGLGIGIGSAGLHFTGDNTWFLAVPGCLAIGWFMIADPTLCLPPRPAEAEVKSSREP